MFDFLECVESWHPVIFGSPLAGKWLLLINCTSEVFSSLTVYVREREGERKREKAQSRVNKNEKES